MKDVNKKEDELKGIKDLIDAIKNEADTVADDSVNYYVFYYGTTKDKKIKAFKTMINENIGKGLNSTLRESINALQSDSIYNYEDNDSEGSSDPELIKSDEVPRLSEIINTIQKTEDILDLKGLKAAASPKFAITMGKITAFGLLRKVSYMKQKKTFMKLNDYGVFDEIESEILLEVPESFSAIHYDGNIVIFNELNFEHIFDYHEKILSIIIGNEDSSKKLFSDMDTFYEVIENDSRKSRKLLYAYSRGYIDSLKISDIVDYAKDFGIEITINPKDNKIDLFKSDKWGVIKAISEDFFIGKWSKQKLAADNKRSIH